MPNRASSSKTGRRARPGKNPSSDQAGTIDLDPAAELLYGKNVVQIALFQRNNHRQVLISATSRNDRRMNEIVHAAESAGVSILRVPRETLDQLLPGVRHGGVALETSPYSYADHLQLSSSTGPVVMLDHIQDPNNVGSILRTAEALGATGAILPRDRSPEITPAVVSASSGATELLPICQVRNLGNVIDEFKTAGWWIAGLDHSPSSTPIQELPDMSPAVLVVGSERRGISPSVGNTCDVLARIEMAGTIESLNASVAAAIALYELTVTSSA